MYRDDSSYMNQLPDACNIDACLERLRLRLKAPESIERPAPGTERKAAAVLIALMRKDNQLSVVYTRRSDRLASHRGEVAFPGGRFDKRDSHLLAAALREAHEEIGIEPQSLDILGAFEGRRTHSTDIFVTPFVGIIKGRPELTPDPKEVDEIFEVPLAILASPHHRSVHRWYHDDVELLRPAIRYRNQVIWGLTYELTVHFLHLLLAPS
jgi:8-oxo-dGTP pyrophosphatase MutT (NUDIX family)